MKLKVGNSDHFGHGTSVFTAVQRAPSGAILHHAQYRKDSMLRDCLGGDRGLAPLPLDLVSVPLGHTTGPSSACEQDRATFGMSSDNA
jgi:hypothetical protein